MNVKLDLNVAIGYTNNSQIARALTENWVSKNIYCPSCGYQHLNDFANNYPVADFYCLKCKAEFELKSKKNSPSLKVVDGAYYTMIERINSNNNPNFFFLVYSNNDFSVKNFLVIPKHYFVSHIIEKRKALGPNARRKGWVGCNILLHVIPEAGKIHFINDEKINDREKVLNDWKRTQFLSTHKKEIRGWTIEIMKILDKIPSPDFSINNIYSFENELSQKYPNNNFIKDKMRQQLQVLRDKGLIEFRGNGNYRKVSI